MSNELIPHEQIVKELYKLLEVNGIVEMYSKANAKDKKKMVEALMKMFSEWQ